MAFSMIVSSARNSEKAGNFSHANKTIVQVYCLLKSFSDDGLKINKRYKLTVLNCTEIQKNYGIHTIKLLSTHATTATTGIHF